MPPSPYVVTGGCGPPEAAGNGASPGISGPLTTSAQS